MLPRIASFVIFAAVTAFCQTRDTASSIFGSVVDTQGAAIPGSTVTATNVATSQVRMTNER